MEGTSRPGTGEYGPPTGAAPGWVRLGEVLRGTSFLLLRQDGRARREVRDLSGVLPGRARGGADRPEPSAEDASLLPPGVTGLDWTSYLRLVRER